MILSYSYSKVGIFAGEWAWVLAMLIPLLDSLYYITRLRLMHYDHDEETRMCRSRSSLGSSLH